MTKHLQIDGCAAIASLRPALSDIPGAIEYLGGPSCSKFYADLLPQLDVVRFGTRTFVTIESLDRIIAANTRPAIERSSKQAEESPNAAADSMDRPNAAATGKKRDTLGDRTRARIARRGRPMSVTTTPV